MLSANILWTDGRWLYEVHHEGEVLEQGELALAAAEAPSPIVVYQLRHRWPALDQRYCVVLHGPQPQDLVYAA